MRPAVWLTWRGHPGYSQERGARARAAPCLAVRGSPRWPGRGRIEVRLRTRRRNAALLSPHREAGHITMSSQPRSEKPGSSARHRLTREGEPDLAPSDDALADPVPSTDDTPTIISRLPPAPPPP